MKITKSEARRIATNIADALFINGFKEEALRLKLVLLDGRDGGGWCKRAAINTIEQELTKKPRDKF